MSLTVEDLKQIKTVVDGSIDQALTTRVEPGFTELETKLTAKIEQEVGALAVATQQQFDQMDERFDRIEDKLGHIEEDLTVTKDLVKDHSFKIARLEHRLPSTG